MSEAITNVLVPGRGHQIMADGSLELTDSAVARVRTAVEYYQDYADDFVDRGGRVRFEGGWAEAAAGIGRPPEDRREGRLMRLLAERQGLPGEYCEEGIESTTTMSNMLHARRSFYRAGKLAVVTQVSQADRFVYCASKALPNTELVIVEAPGEEDPEIIADEQRLLRQSRILFGAAYGPRMLHAADRLGVLAGRLAGIRPGAKYGAGEAGV